MQRLEKAPSRKGISPKGDKRAATESSRVLKMLRIATAPRMNSGSRVMALESLYNR